MDRIEYFLSILSPFTYLTGGRLEQIAARYGAELNYRPLDIMALFGRTGGVPVPQRFEGRIAYRLQELRRISARTGMDINLKPAHWPTNAAPGSYAIIAAQKDGNGDTGVLVQALLRSCWADEKDIAEDGVIRACLEEAGFDPALADSGLLSGAETYAANLEEAVNRGVFGSPFYMVGEEMFWGQDRLDDLDWFLAGKFSGA